MLKKLFERQETLMSITLRGGIGTNGFVNFFDSLRRLRLVEAPIDENEPKPLFGNEELDAASHKIRLTRRQRANQEERETELSISDSEASTGVQTAAFAKGGVSYTPGLFVIDLEDAKVTGPFRQPSLFTGCGSKPSESGKFEVRIEGRAKRDRDCIFCLCTDRFMGHLKHAVAACREAEFDLQTFLTSERSSVIGDDDEARSLFEDLLVADVFASNKEKRSLGLASILSSLPMIDGRLEDEDLDGGCFRASIELAHDDCPTIDGLSYGLLIIGPKTEV